MNPFVYGGPVASDQFVGRRREADIVLDRLANPYNRGSSAINGSRGIGKTSFLQYVMHAAREAQWNLSENAAYFIFLSCSSIPLNDNGFFDDAEFWRYVLRSLAQELPDKLKARAEEMVQSSEVTNAYYLVTLSKDIAEFDKLVILLLDEFEYLFEHNHPTKLRLLSILSSLINQPAPRGLALITASKETLFALSSRSQWLGSPFCNDFVQITLGPFNEDEVNELIDFYLAGTGVEFSLQDRQFVRQVSQGHPEQVQYACSLLFDKKLEAIHERG